MEEIGEVFTSFASSCQIGGERAGHVYELSLNGKAKTLCGPIS